MVIGIFEMVSPLQSICPCSEVIPVDRVLQGNGAIWRPGVGTIVEKILVVPKHDADWSCKLLCPLGVEDKSRHAAASEYGGETSDSSTKAFFSIGKPETIRKMVIFGVLSLAPATQNSTLRRFG